MSRDIHLLPQTPIEISPQPRLTTLPFNERPGFGKTIHLHPNSGFLIDNQQVERQTQGFLTVVDHQTKHSIITGGEYASNPQLRDVMAGINDRLACQGKDPVSADSIATRMANIVTDRNTSSAVKQEKLHQLASELGISKMDLDRHFGAEVKKGLNDGIQKIENYRDQRLNQLQQKLREAVENYGPGSQTARQIRDDIRDLKKMCNDEIAEYQGGIKQIPNILVAFVRNTMSLFGA